MTQVDFRHLSTKQHLQERIWPASFCLLQHHMCWEMHIALSIRDDTHVLCVDAHSHFHPTHTITHSYLNTIICTGSHILCHLQKAKENFFFSLSTPKLTEQENKGRWTHGAKSSDGWQRTKCDLETETPEIKMTRLQVSLPLFVFSPDAAWQTTLAFYRETSSLII